MTRVLVLVVLVLCLCAVAVQAADRSPADLMPANVGLYVDLNLGVLTGASADAAVLQDAFGLAKLTSLAQNAVSKDPKAAAELNRILALVTSTGQGLGWRVGWGMQVEPLALASGGQPNVYVVANVADSQALSQALPALLKQLGLQAGPPTTQGDVTLQSLLGEQASLVQGKDWVAFVFPAAAVSDVVKLASGENKDSLAANADYQQALTRVPRDPLLVEYLSAPTMKQAVALATMALPDVQLPPPPDHGGVVAVSLHVEEVGGQRVLQAVSQTDLDLATFLVQGPLTAAVSEAAGRAGQSGHKTQCLANVKNLAIAMNMYLTDYDQFPKADRWVTALEDYMKNDTVLKCPEDTSDAKCSYGMNWGLSGKKTSVISDAARKVVIYETANPGPCPRGGKTDVVSPPRHMGGNNFGYVDGHAKWLPEAAAKEQSVMDW